LCLSLYLCLATRWCCHKYTPLPTLPHFRALQLTQDPRKAALPLSPDAAATGGAGVAGAIPSVVTHGPSGLHARSLIGSVAGTPSPTYSPTAHVFSVAPPGLLGPGLLPRQDSLPGTSAHDTAPAAAPADVSASAPKQAGTGSRAPPPLETSPAPRAAAGNSNQGSHAVSTKDGNEATLSGWDASNVPTPTRGPTRELFEHA
jgi:hypothetical protein